MNIQINQISSVCKVASSEDQVSAFQPVRNGEVNTAFFIGDKSA